MDTVFKNITKEYDNKLLNIIYNTLLLLDNVEEQHKPNYIDGILKIITPTNNLVRNWIRTNLTC